MKLYRQKKTIPLLEFMDNQRFDKNCCCLWGVVVYYYLLLYVCAWKRQKSVMNTWTWWSHVDSEEWNDFMENTKYLSSLLFITTIFHQTFFLPRVSSVLLLRMLVNKRLNLLCLCWLYITGRIKWYLFYSRVIVFCKPRLYTVQTIYSTTF